ncbi:MAG: chemotaxis protein CheW [Vicinamibacterales bacterium]
MERGKADATPLDGAAALAGKYLTFRLGQEEFGLPVLRVREIIKMMSITQVPQVPPHVKGVINLRGKVIPVVDLRLKFGLESSEYSERTCIIVVEVSTRGARVMLGMVVDAVSEVVTLQANELETAPDFGAHIDLGYVSAMAKVKDSVKILLDLDRVLGTDAAAALAA